MINPSDAALWEGLEAYLEALEEIPFQGLNSIPWDVTLGSVPVGQAKGSISFAMSGEPQGFEQWRQERVVSLAVRMETATPRADYLNMQDYQSTLGEAICQLSQTGLPAGEFRGFEVGGGLCGIKPAGGISHGEESIAIRNIDGAETELARIDLMLRYVVEVPNDWESRL